MGLSGFVLVCAASKRGQRPYAALIDEGAQPKSPRRTATPRTSAFKRSGTHGDPLGETVAALALRAVRTLSPEDKISELEFGVIVGGLDAVFFDERPERRAVREDVGARARHARDVGGGRTLKRRLDLLSQWRDPRDERRAVELFRP